MSKFDNCQVAVDVLFERERLKIPLRPKTASLIDGMDPETLTKEEAFTASEPPKVLEPDGDSQITPTNPDPETETSEEEIPEITVHNGPYGPYLRFGDDTRSLGDDDDPFTIT